MRRRVTLACGHSFVEHCPDDTEESSPRVCSVIDHVRPDYPGRPLHVPYNPGVLYMTDQGMAMSNVIEYESLDENAWIREDT